MTCAIIFDLTWIILNNLFVLKHAKVQNDFHHVNIDCVWLTSACFLILMWRKTNYIIISNFLSLPLAKSIDAPLYGFLVLIMSCLISNHTTTFHLEIYFLKLDSHLQKVGFIGFIQKWWIMLFISFLFLFIFLKALFVLKY